MNPARGEAGMVVAGMACTLRPSFERLVAAEQELGPLFALAERAVEGRMTLAEIAALFWHCLDDPPEGVTRERLGEAIMADGLAATAKPLRVLIGQILTGA